MASTSAPSFPYDTPRAGSPALSSGSNGSSSTASGATRSSTVTLVFRPRTDNSLGVADVMPLIPGSNQCGAVVATLHRRSAFGSDPVAKHPAKAPAPSSAPTTPNVTPSSRHSTDVVTLTSSEAQRTVARMIVPAMAFASESKSHAAKMKSEEEIIAKRASGAAMPGDHFTLSYRKDPSKVLTMAGLSITQQQQQQQQNAKDSHSIHHTVSQTHLQANHPSSVTSGRTSPSPSTASSHSHSHSHTHVTQSSHYGQPEEEDMTNWLVANLIPSNSHRQFKISGLPDVGIISGGSAGACPEWTAVKNPVGYLNAVHEARTVNVLSPPGTPLSSHRTLQSMSNVMSSSSSSVFSSDSNGSSHSSSTKQQQYSTQHQATPNPLSISFVCSLNKKVLAHTSYVSVTPSASSTPLSSSSSSTSADNDKRGMLAVTVDRSLPERLVNVLVVSAWVLLEANMLNGWHWGEEKVSGDGVYSGAAAGGAGAKGECCVM
ncbi:hypothetical protein HDU76_001214 [Blyttiomyces sp. JEL0837]|nr:hypothetical protein HDU76_001214 [Blyttiomyces sp. JEL0837]